MKGNKDDVINCLTEVYSVLEGVPPRGLYRYYDPSTYNGYNVSDYGGYMDNQQTSRANHSYVKRFCSMLTNISNVLIHFCSDMHNSKVIMNTTAATIQ